MKFIYVSPEKGIEIIAQAQKPTLHEIQDLVGISGEDAFVENLQLCFSDRTIVILCDDERDIKNLPLLATSPVGDQIRGSFLIMGSHYTDVELDYTGLTDAQISIVLNELRLEES
jgi:hypothetical protein